MRARYALLPLLAAALAACGGGGEAGTTAPPPPPPPPPAPTVFLKDIAIDRLPSPYYHFEYDAAGRVSVASFASGFTSYEVTYDGGRIRELRNNTLGNQDRVVYTYDAAGRVSVVEYVTPGEEAHARVHFSYDGQKLTRVERERRLAGGFVVDKTMTLTYYADGNLLELTDHRPAVDGLQSASTTVDRFERYDDGINVDGFGLLHNDFFDHLVLLPGVQLQRGNPGRETLTGDGTNLVADYSYTYDAQHRPLTKSGVATITNGQNPGQTFPLRTEFSYY